MPTMLSNDTLDTHKLLTRLTVQLQLSLLMLSTVEGTLFSFLVLLQDIQEVVGLKSWLEACRSIGWNRGDLTTVRTGQDELSLLVSVHQSPEALLTVDMVALELLGVSIGV